MRIADPIGRAENECHHVAEGAREPDASHLGQGGGPSPEGVLRDAAGAGRPVRRGGGHRHDGAHLRHGDARLLRGDATGDHPPQRARPAAPQGADERGQVPAHA